MWGEGPWQSEPDREEWVDPVTGYHCIARRSHSLGAWCGYVGIPKEHPYNGKSSRDIDNIYVHGGLTYSEECNGEPGSGICHKVEDCKDHAWWLGFDCGHFGDYSPAMESVIPTHIIYTEVDAPLPDISYKTLDYTKNEITSLASQLKAMEAR